MIRFGLRFNWVVTDDARCKAFLPGFASASSWREATFQSRMQMQMQE
jgi:hypothetical protein